MIRPSVLFIRAAALAALCLPAFVVSAQSRLPAAPVPVPSAAAAQPPASPAAATAPQAPVPSNAAAQAPAAPAKIPAVPAPAPAAPVFPKPLPTDFTAVSPTQAEVGAFLHANWGYDPNRVWQVQGILKTPAEGVSKVIVLVAEKGRSKRPGVLVFFALPGGNYLISGNSLMPFGAHPFAAARAELEQSADGPFQGSASKSLELVEFADFQDPQTKAAQANIDKLAADFPQARIVFQNNPIPSMHPEAVRAAEYGVCVDKLGGNTDFFKYAAAVLSGQSGLATPDGATMTLNSATVAAGLDPSKVAACAATSQTQAEVVASIKLGLDIGVQTGPTLMINGRSVPADAPYSLLKTIVEFQAKLDGVPLTH